MRHWTSIESKCPHTRGKPSLERYIKVRLQEHNFPKNISGSNTIIGYFSSVNIILNFGSFNPIACVENVVEKLL